MRISDSRISKPPYPRILTVVDLLCLTQHYLMRYHILLVPLLIVPERIIPSLNTQVLRQIDIKPSLLSIHITIPLNLEILGIVGRIDRKPLNNKLVSQLQPIMANDRFFSHLHVPIVKSRRPPQKFLFNYIHEHLLFASPENLFFNYSLLSNCVSSYSYSSIFSPSFFSSENLKDSRRKANTFGTNL